MARAVVCPVCGGSGRVISPDFGGTYGLLSPPTDTTDAICHGCRGKGWVEVSK